ncbi:DsbA family protein [Actinoplanes couchii]|uniref:Membrane protein n=1 Tax=Actinoplanes couchii TaxID=403638 RepID=A0ABQ3XEA8_9ACTN|nr:DsbA family protein [Actinoplanes couchii]MDR6317340.1 protein-disulfide isomerase [Actinoplanes couchii]GID56833.1 membrane protein [Actinoplanes couchii]
MGKQARNRSKDLRKGQAAIAGRGEPNPVMIGGLVVIVALVAAIGFMVVRAAGGSASAASGPLVVPAGATDGALVTGQASAPVELEIYLDYMCPYCGNFERANNAEIDKLVAAGTARVKLHPLNFLDRFSEGTRYSTRAANAVATVADRAPEKLMALNKALFDNQPEEGSEGLSDSRIAELALAAGVPQAVVDVLDDGIFSTWVNRSNDTAFESGITGTPTVKINGQKYEGDLYNAGPLTQAITSAAGTS